jgi:flagellar hook protein FlgE
MMRSLFSGVSGLKSHQTRMDVIGNNIANVNTTGFKSSRVTFQDTLNQTLVGASSSNGTTGGTNPEQIGLGVGIGSIDTIMTDGSTETTGKNTDLAISGSGFFIVNNGSNSYYTRDGAFSFDEDGYYVLPGSGVKVQGWNGDPATDSISTSGAPTDIKVPADSSLAAKATTKAAFTKNLNASAPTITSMTAVLGDGTSSTKTTGSFTMDTTGTTSATAKSITLTMSDGTTQTVTTGTTTYTATNSMPVTTTMTVYDSLGNKYAIPMTLEKKGGSANTWTATIAANAAGKDSAGNVIATNAAVSQDIVFNADGSYKSGSPATLNFTAFNDNAAAPSSVTLDFTGLTQYASESTASCTTSDGYPSGSLKSVSFDSSGILTATYTNNERRKIAQVAMATFNNPAGLEKSGGSLYSVSNNSGKVQIATVSASGCKVTPSAIEMSNVDLASEFSSMIVTQRGYQSNSKIITVSDEMLETLIGMKR